MKFNNKIKNNLYILFIVLIISSNALLFVISNYYNTSLDCSDYVYDFNSYSETVYKNNTLNKTNFTELDLFPNKLEGVLCIGNELIDKDGLRMNITSTSSKIFELVNFVFLICNFLLFMKSKKLGLIPFFIANLINYLFLVSIFYKSLIINSSILSVIFSALIFYLINEVENLSSNDLIKNLFIFIVTHTAIFYYDLFANSLIILFLIFLIYNHKFIFNKSQLKSLKITLFTYYLLRFFSSFIDFFNDFWQRLSINSFSGDPVFGDLNYIFTYINCKSLTNNCKNVYGPLLEIGWSNVNAFPFVIILGGFQILFLILYINKVFGDSNNSFVLFLLFLSPPLTFVMETMNVDILIYTIMYFAILRFKKNDHFSSLIVLSLVAQLKIYPIFFFLGFLLKLFFNKKYKILASYSFVFFGNLVSLLFFYINIRFSDIPNPTGIEWTFGLSSHIENYINLFNISFHKSLVYLFLLQIFAFIYLKKFNYFKLHSKNVTINTDIYVYLMVFVLCSLYYNFDYRLSVFIFIIPQLLKSQNLILFTKPMMIFLLTCVSPYYIRTNIYDLSISNFFPFLYVVVNHISFYLTLNLSVFLLINKTKTWYSHFQNDKHMKKM
jgi:hypothetical protein